MASSQQKAEKRSMSSRSDSGRFFFGCFRPGVADRDGGLVRSRSTPLKGSDAKRSVLAYISFDDEGNKVDVLQRIVPYRRACEGEVAVRPLKDGTSKRLVSATKAAFFDMSLVRKVQKKRNPKKTEEPCGQLRKKADQILRLVSERSEEPGKRDFDVSSSSWSSFAATSLSSSGSTRSLSPGSSSNSLDHGASKLLMRRGSSPGSSFNGQDGPLVLVRKLSPSADTPLCLILLLALVVLIFCGKVCAIVCTSSCLVFYLPAWVPQNKSSDTAADDQESVDSAEYKKRVIMEGLLRRQQRPRGLQRWSSS